MKRFTRFINLISRCGLQYREVELQEIGLNAANHMYIFCVCRQPGVSQEQLSKMLHINKSNVARSLKNLEESGFIYKEINTNDKRNYCIYPTNKAKESLPFLVEKIEKWNQFISRGLSENEIDTLYSLLKKVALNASEYNEKMKFQEGIDEDETNI